MAETKIKYIKRKLTDIHSQVTIDKEFNLQDVNIEAEEVFRRVLNATYSWNLIDANKKIKNFPAIDLIDESNKIVLQVTSSLGTKKINDTLDGFEKFKDNVDLEKYAEYRLMFCYILKEKEVRTDKFFKDKNLKNDDFIDITDILEVLDEDNEGGVYKVLKSVYVDDDVVKKTETHIEGGLMGVGNNSGIVNQNITNNYYNYPPNKEKNEMQSIISLSNEKSFLDEVFRSIQREEPVMLLSMTSTPYHNKVAKYYKDKIYEMAIEHYSKNAIFSFHPSSNEEISQAKYFSKLAKQCGFEQDILDGDDFIESLDNKLMSQDICLLISEFENGSDKYRREFALALRPLLLDNDSEHSCSIVILGRKRLAKLKYEENGGGNSPLNYFEELLIPTPTIEDYKKIENIEEDISNIYQLTGGHPELMKFCLRNKSEDYQSLILNSNYGDKFFGKYQSRSSRLLKLFKDESFGAFSLWSSDELMRDLFWDNLIIEEGNRFKWIAPIVAELGKRYFR